MNPNQKEIAKVNSPRPDIFFPEAIGAMDPFCGRESCLAKENIGRLSEVAKTMSMLSSNSGIDCVP